MFHQMYYSAALVGMLALHPGAFVNAAMIKRRAILVPQQYLQPARFPPITPPSLLRPGAASGVGILLPESIASIRRPRASTQPTLCPIGAWLMHGP